MIVILIEKYILIRGCNMKLFTFGIVLVLSILIFLLILLLRKYRKVRKHMGKIEEYLKSIAPTLKSNEILRQILEISFEKQEINIATSNIIKVLVENYDIDYCSIFIVKNSELIGSSSTIRNKDIINSLEVYVNSLLKDMNTAAKLFSSINSTLNYDTAKERNVSFSYFIPLSNGESLLGALLIENKSYQDNSEIEIEIFKVITDVISITLQNLIYYDKIVKSAHTDKLTQVSNRNAMDEYLDTVIEDCEGRPSIFSIAVLDIDHFKRFNDTYGHQFGDLVLKEVAQYINRNIRPTDRIFRYGGEEFVIHFSGISNENIYERIDTIREGISKLILEDGKGAKASVTVSFGLSEYPQNGSNIKELIKNADEALYYAKKNGRNKVIIFNHIN